ncbi:sulfatase [Maribacter sp. 2210JD10-5]|uniref:sulfatase n=1 Tax=Maribacter sp. 2210JD10-5 TaxID=3386272 RepID=UPI0039BD4847
MRHYIGFLVFALLSLGCNEKQKEKGKIAKKPNILFISIDDLRPELNVYGQSQIVSPNIDALGADATVFNKSFCTVPVCGASRASIMTGIHPTPSRFVDYGSRIDEEATGVISLVEHFKNNGYFTTSVGKILHHPNDGLKGWSEQPFRPDYPNTLNQQELWRDYQSEENKENYNTSMLPLGAPGPAWEAADVSDNTYFDGKTADAAVAKLDALVKAKEPFFFGVGFIRPHLPFNAPKKYWDLYNPKEIELAENTSFPKDVPLDAWHNSGELRSYNNIPNDTLPIFDEQALKLRHGYYASVSYIDAQVGKVIDKLKALGLYEETIIVLWGDHGWSFGEHGLWCKHSCFTNALRAPLIMKSIENKHGKTDALVSFVDVYPTLCELADLEKPSHLVGKSFASILKNPEEKGNEYIYARWQNGETIKSDRYTLTQYFDKNGKPKSQMLYDNFTDPAEDNNIAETIAAEEALQTLAKALQLHLENRK